MSKEVMRRVRRLNIATHRDLGYFFSSLIIVYCLSGLALNHVNEWNPDFIITKQNVDVGRIYSKNELDNDVIDQLGVFVGEKRYKVYDFPTEDQVKIYYNDASLLLRLSDGKGTYEKVSRRPVFYESNLLHRNSLDGWKWVSDIFAILLITINLTGIFILKGKHGLTGRGKWLIAAGAIPPFLALVISELI